MAGECQQSVVARTSPSTLSSEHDGYPIANTLPLMGGGVRGISSLYIKRTHSPNYTRAQAGESSLPRSFSSSMWVLWLDFRGMCLRLLLTWNFNVTLSAPSERQIRLLRWYFVEAYTSQKIAHWDHAFLFVVSSAFEGVRSVGARSASILCRDDGKKEGLSRGPGTTSESLGGLTTMLCADCDVSGSIWESIEYWIVKS